jgi:hypothetical protein
LGTRDEKVVLSIASDQAASIERKKEGFATNFRHIIYDRKETSNVKLASINSNSREMNARKTKKSIIIDTRRYNACVKVIYLEKL